MPVRRYTLEKSKHRRRKPKTDASIPRPVVSRFRPGDMVRTPTGRIAQVVAVRQEQRHNLLIVRYLRKSGQVNAERHELREDIPGLQLFPRTLPEGT